MKQAILLTIHKWLLLLTICLCTTTTTTVAQVIVEAHTDTANILIGEQIQLSLKCTVNAKQRVQFPNLQPQQQLTPGVEIVNCGRVDTLLLNDGKRMQLARKYTITSFDSAVYNIPPFQVEVDGKKYASRGNVGLKVSTVPVDLKHTDKFNGPHDVVDQPFEWSWTLILTTLVATLLLIVVCALAIRLSDPKLITRKVVVHPPTPAHITALNHIEKIKLDTKSDVKQYYMELTEALRTYIEKRFGFSAREMTTNEIIDQLNATGNEQALAELKDILITADLVKFAKHATTISEQDRSLVQALDYVQTTKLAPQQLPRPRIEYVSLSNKKQILWRNIMHVTMWGLLVATIILCAYNVWTIYCCFG